MTVCAFNFKKYSCFKENYFSLKLFILSKLIVLPWIRIQIQCIWIHNTVTNHRVISYWEQSTNPPSPSSLNSGKVGQDKSPVGRIGNSKLTVLMPWACNTLVPNTADSGSGVGQRPRNLMKGVGVSGGVLCSLYIVLLYVPNPTFSAGCGFNL